MSPLSSTRLLQPRHPASISCSNNSRPAYCPVPDRDAGFGENVVVDLGVILADRLPAALGENVTLTVQLLFAASNCPQLFVWAKSALFAPANFSPCSATFMLVERFVSVTVIGALVCPTVTFPKFSVEGESAICVSCPLKSTDCGGVVLLIFNSAVRGVR